MTLIRRGTNGATTEFRHTPLEPEAEAPDRPTSRVVRFEVPDGFMATISLIPYTEPPTEPEESD